MRNFTPTLSRVRLITIAGIVWMSIGLYLSGIALGWLKPWNDPSTPSIIALGFTFAVLIGGLGFSWFARRNLARIEDLPEKTCLFAFQGWTSYPLILVMMTMGILLRHSSLPKTLLAPVYLGIGGGLMIASIHYFHRLKTLWGLS